MSAEPGADLSEQGSFVSLLRAKLAEPPSAARRLALQVVAFRMLHDLVTLPFFVAALHRSERIDPAYGITFTKLFRLALRMQRNSLRVFTATSYRAHMAMAVKLFEVPRSVEGAVVECGSFLGGSAVNLSLACELAGRDLIIYDSFEGMPEPEGNDRYATAEAVGAFRGTLETVRGNIERFGAIDVCTFRKGLFKDTLPDHREPVVVCFLDVDWQASLHDCLQHLWPRLVDRGQLFIDEYVLLDFCAVFFSERYWREHFDCTPPGLLGAGTGVPLDHTYLGPFLNPAPLQSASSIAYTWKGSSGFWDYVPAARR